VLELGAGWGFLLHLLRGYLRLRLDFGLRLFVLSPEGW
jgi:hypothetical protein